MGQTPLEPNGELEVTVFPSVRCPKFLGVSLMKKKKKKKWGKFRPSGFGVCERHISGAINSCRRLFRRFVADRRLKKALLGWFNCRRYIIRVLQVIRISEQREIEADRERETRRDVVVNTIVVFILPHRRHGDRVSSFVDRKTEGEQKARKEES